jgi:hypothetical protein
MPSIDNTQQTKYINYVKDIKNNEGINQHLVETINEERKEYILLIIWLIIAIFVFSITIITIISEKEMNPYLRYIITGIILCVFFYLINHIYNIFNI